MISENLEKSLGDWKLPPSSALDVFEPRGCFSCLPDCRVKTVEKEIRLHEGFAMFPLLSNYRKKAHQICYNFLHVGMIQVALKPTKLGSNASAIVSLRDNRLRDPSSVLGMVESSLCDGPIYFFYLPTYCVPFSDSRDSFGIDVEIEGDESITLMYRFHYKVLKEPYVMDFSRRFPVDERGKTTLYLTNIAQNNRVVWKTISWGHQIGTGEGLVADESDLASSGEVGNGNVDWKETVKAHVLKVDVPGFKKKEVRVVVDDGRVLQLSGERSNEQEYEDEDETDKWHCEERSSGKFLRRLRLPENANLDEVKAAVDFGVLTVTVPKDEVDNKSEGEVTDISD